MTEPTIGLVRAIKTGDEWALDVLGIPFGGPNGGKDSDGEYFTAQTKLYLDRYTPLPLYYHGYDENGVPHGEPQILGKTASHEVRQDGVWFRVILDKASDYAKRVWDAAQQGIARASSGSIAHLVRKSRDGQITHWPMAELSIFDTGGKRQPANQYAVALPVLKAVYDQAGLTLPADIEDEDPDPKATATGATAQKTEAEKAQASTDTNRHSNGVPNMDEKELQALIAKTVADALKAKADSDAAEAKRQEDEAERVKAAAEKAAKAMQEEMQAKLDAAEKTAKEAKDALDAAKSEDRRLPGGGEAPYQTKFANISKFDGIEPIDLAFAYGVLDAAKTSGKSRHGASEDLMKALAIGIVESKDENGEFQAAKRAMGAQIKGVALKANELNQSTLATYGDEWVGVTYSTQLWRRIILPTSVLGRIPTITVPRGSESIIIPVESTPPTFYLVAQASAQATNPGPITETITTSKMGTTNKTLTVGKLGAAAQYTGELEEDSLIPWASELRRSLTDEAQRVLEHVVIDGDTATGATTNINDIAGTPAGTEADRKSVV